MALAASVSTAESSSLEAANKVKNVILFYHFVLTVYALLFIVIDIHDIIHGISDKIIGNIFYVIIYCMTYISTCQ